MFCRIMLLFVLMCGVAIAGGCSPYVDDFCYNPHPAIAEIRPITTRPAQSQGAASLVTAYATIVGVRRADGRQHIPLSVEVRLRLDNHGQGAVRFDPRRLKLTNGDLVEFPKPLVALQSIDVMPNMPAVIEAYFPFPRGFSYDNMEMRNLQLHWELETGASTVTQRADFRRVTRYYFEDRNWGLPSDYPYVQYGAGGMMLVR